jgi:hypothetical protein
MAGDQAAKTGWTGPRAWWDCSNTARGASPPMPFMPAPWYKSSGRLEERSYWLSVNRDFLIRQLRSILYYVSDIYTGRLWLPMQTSSSQTKWCHRRIKTLLLAMDWDISVTEWNMQNTSESTSMRRMFRPAPGSRQCSSRTQSATRAFGRQVWRELRVRDTICGSRMAWETFSWANGGLSIFTLDLRTHSSEGTAIWTS